MAFRKAITTAKAKFKGGSPVAEEGRNKENVTSNLNITLLHIIRSVSIIQDIYIYIYVLFVLHVINLPLCDLLRTVTSRESNHKVVNGTR